MSPKMCATRVGPNCEHQRRALPVRDSVVKNVNTRYGDKEEDIQISALPMLDIIVDIRIMFMDIVNVWWRMMCANDDYIYAIWNSRRILDLCRIWQEDELLERSV